MTMRSALTAQINIGFLDGSHRSLLGNGQTTRSLKYSAAIRRSSNTGATTNNQLLRRGGTLLSGLGTPLLLAVLRLRGRGLNGAVPLQLQGRPPRDGMLDGRSQSQMAAGILAAPVQWHRRQVWNAKRTSFAISTCCKMSISGCRLSGGRSHLEAGRFMPLTSTRRS